MTGHGADLLQPVPWETRNLGLPSYALRVEAVDDPAALRRALADAAEAGPIFVQAKVPLRDLRLSPVLASAGFYAVETALCPHANLARCPALDAFERDPAAALPDRRGMGDLRFIELSPDDRPGRDAVRAIAGCAFQDDRFHVDPHCDRAVADRRFVLWVEEMFAQARTFYLLYVAGEPAGFMVRHEEHLPLAGFAPAHARSGLGAFLWLSTLADMRRRGLKRVHTTISANNTGVLNLYARMGFRFRDPAMIHHYWSAHAPA